MLTVVLSTQAFAKSRLVLTPDTCVVKSDENCQTEIVVNVINDSTKGEYCLSVPAIGYYYCNPDDSDHQFKLNFAYNKPVKFYLIDKYSGETITSAKFSVMVFHPVVSRKRRGFSWSFNSGIE